MSYIHQALEAECKREATTISRKFSSLNLNPSSASKIAKVRPSDSTIRIICAPKSWQNPKSGRRILAAHLKDEVVRSGYSVDDFYLGVSYSSKSDFRLEDALTIIDSFASKKKSFRSLILDIAKIVSLDAASKATK